MCSFFLMDVLLFNKNKPVTFKLWLTFNCGFNYHRYTINLIWTQPNHAMQLYLNCLALTLLVLQQSHSHTSGMLVPTVQMVHMFTSSINTCKTCKRSVHRYINLFSLTAFTTGNWNIDITRNTITKWHVKQHNDVQVKLHLYCILCKILLLFTILQNAAAAELGVLGHCSAVSTRNYMASNVLSWLKRW